MARGEATQFEMREVEAPPVFRATAIPNRWVKLEKVARENPGEWLKAGPVPIHSARNAALSLKRKGLKAEARGVPVEKGRVQQGFVYVMAPGAKKAAAAKNSVVSRNGSVKPPAKPRPKASTIKRASGK